MESENAKDVPAEAVMTETKASEEPSPREEEARAITRAVNGIAKLVSVYSRRNGELTQALRGAIGAIEGLADQQAMPDESYKPALDAARAALGVR